MGEISKLGGRALNNISVKIEYKIVWGVTFIGI